jgi:hypothetical protein
MRSIGYAFTGIWLCDIPLRLPDPPPPPTKPGTSPSFVFGSRCRSDTSLSHHPGSVDRATNRPTSERISEVVSLLGCRCSASTHMYWDLASVSSGSQAGVSLVLFSQCCVFENEAGLVDTNEQSHAIWQNRRMRRALVEGDTHSHVQADLSTRLVGWLVQGQICWYNPGGPVGSITAVMIGYKKSVLYLTASTSQSGAIPEGGAPFTVPSIPTEQRPARDTEYTSHGTSQPLHWTTLHPCSSKYWLSARVCRQRLDCRICTA